MYGFSPANRQSPKVGALGDAQQPAEVAADCWRESTLQRYSF